MIAARADYCHRDRIGRTSWLVGELAKNVFGQMKANNIDVNSVGMSGVAVGDDLVLLEIIQQTDREGEYLRSLSEQKLNHLNLHWLTHARFIYTGVHGFRASE